MDNTELIFGYAIWVITVGLTLGFFLHFSKKYKSFGMLFLFVFIPVWIIVSILQGLSELYFNNINMLLPDEIIFLFIFTLPTVLVFSGIPFVIKFLKLRRSSM